MTKRPEDGRAPGRVRAYTSCIIARERDAAGETRLTSGWAYSIISRAVCIRAGCGWASVAQWQSISLVMRRLWVRFPPLAPKQKVIRKDDLLFWVPAARGRLHPPVFQMLGASELPLRRGFACGKTLVRRKCAAGQKAGCSGWMQSFRNFKISILTILHKTKGHPKG